MHRKIIIFTGPSGVGKTTVGKELFKNLSLNIALSISATTRMPRKEEENGKNYYFITKKDFEQKIRNNEFVEYSHHFSHQYGTLKNEIKRIFENQCIPFLEIETIGAKKVIEKYGKDNIISIFLAPPSIDELKTRINARGSETKQEIKERLARVEMEMSDVSSFDYVVFNDNVEMVVKKITNIIKKETMSASNC